MEKDKKTSFKHRLIKNDLTGSYLNCYIGYATDYNIRYHSSSGGLITALLIFMIEHKLIDGALVTRMKKDNPLRPETFIARTKEEIFLAKGSKYCPVSIANGLKGILDSNSSEKFVVVGLPCHIQAIKKLEERNENLKKKIVLHLGLFCNHTPKFRATEILLKKLKVKPEEIIQLDYRGEGWPGCMRISKKDGDILSLSDHWSFIGSDFFTPKNCFMCTDHTSELADISFGDAWLPEFKNDKVGTSILISRSNMGEEILKSANSEEIINLNPIFFERVVLSQLAALYLKKKNIKANARLFRSKKTEDNIIQKIDFIDYFLALFSRLNYNFSQIKFFRRILECLPLKIFTLYNRLLKFPYNKKALHDFKKYLS